MKHTEIRIVWCLEDVVMRAEERDIALTEKQAIKILTNLDKCHDANIGINWNVIDIHTDLVIKEDKK